MWVSEVAIIWRRWVDIMFAPKVPTSQAKASDPDAGLARRPRRSPVTQALMLQRTVGNQATLRLLSQGAAMISEHERGEQQSQAPWLQSLAMWPSASVGMWSIAEAIRKASVENGATEPPSQAAFLAAAARVRLRDDASADRSAHLLGAHAVAFGDQILFRSGRYAPNTEMGQALIAHELTHVAHQGQTGRPYPQRLVAGDVLSVQFTQAMAAAMTDRELDQQMQLLRAHLQREPGDLGAAENLATLEAVAYARQGTAQSASPRSAPTSSGLAQPASIPPTQASQVTAPGQQKSGEEEQHSEIWWWMREHGRLTMTKHDRAEVQRTLIKQAGAVLLDNAGFPVDIDQLSDDEVIAIGPEILKPRREDQPLTRPEIAAALSRKEFADIIGWGEGNAAQRVKQTEDVTAGLTRDKVKEMITKRGLTKESVLENIKLYENAATDPVKVAKNTQLLPRLNLLKRLLELWPE
jgi:hypothetical protein